jgi:muconolactone delta-isomerase
MRVLVIGTPKFPIPPEQLPEVVDGAVAWSERHRDSLEVLGTFAGGGGFGILDVPDEETLNQIVMEMPFSWFSQVEVRPFVAGDAGLRQVQQAVHAMSHA